MALVDELGDFGVIIADFGRNGQIYEERTDPTLMSG